MIIVSIFEILSLIYTKAVAFSSVGHESKFVDKSIGCFAIYLKEIVIRSDFEESTVSFFIAFIFDVRFVVNCIEEVTNRIFSNLIVDLDTADVLFIPKYRESIDFVVTADLSEWFEIIEFFIFFMFNSNQDVSWDEGISEDLCLEVLHEQRGRARD